MMNSNKTILLVEDDAIIALNQSGLLEKRGYTVIHTFNGKKAIEIMQNKRVGVDLILMDINLGNGMDGTEAAAQILEREEIPIVFLSSHTEPDIVEKTESITSYGYVVKNSNITVLDASIKMAFKLFEERQKSIKHQNDSEKANKELNAAITKLERLDRAIATTKDVLFITDIRGIITYINPRFTELYGYTPEETLGLLTPEIIGINPVTDKNNWNLSVDTSPGERFYTYFYIKKKNGTSITVEASITPIRNKNNEITEYVQIHRDITQQLLTEKKELIKSRYLTFLNKISREQADSRNFAELANLICNQLKNFTGAVFSTFSEYDPTNKTLTHVRIAASKTILDRAIKISDNNILFTVVPVTDVYYTRIINERIKIFPSLFENTHRAIGRDVSTLINTEFGIDRILGLAYYIDGRLYGTSSVGLQGGEDNPDTVLLESFINITSISIRRLLLEEETMETEKILSDIFEQSHLGIYRTNPEGKILLANPSMINMLGYSSFDEIKDWDLNTANFAPGYNRKEFLTRMERDGRIKGIEAEWIRKDGTTLYIRESSTAVRDENGRIRYFQGMVEDISEKVQAEKDLKIKEEMLDIITENAYDLIWIIDLGLTVIYMSHSVEKLLGYTPEEILDMNISKLFTNKEYRRVYSLAEKELNAGYSQRYLIFTTHHLKKDGSETPVEIKARIIYSNTGKPLYIQGYSRDISEQVRTESQLKLFFDQSMTGFFFMMLDEPVLWNDEADKDAILDHVMKTQKVTMLNDALADQYRINKEEMIGKPTSYFFKHDENYGKMLTKNLFDAGHIHTETMEKRFDGTTMYVEGNYVCMYDNAGRITGNFGAQVDITKRKEAEHKILKLLKQKDIILRESHHRIKNNLMAVRSMINIEAASLKDDRACTVMNNLKNRIDSMILLYDQLSGLNSFSGKNSTQYIQALIQQMVKNFLGNHSIQIIPEIEDFTMSAQTSFNLGLIINEILTNADKYAFPHESGGIIHVSLHKDDSSLILKVSDNGKGIPEKTMAQGGKGFGLELIRILAEEQKGYMEITVQNGTTFTIKMDL